MPQPHTPESTRSAPLPQFATLEQPVDRTDDLAMALRAHKLREFTRWWHQHCA
jgi:hypothetical protein